jgi:DNA ligase-1
VNKENTPLPSGTAALIVPRTVEDASSIDPTGWLWTEKLDGVRAYWDGKKLYAVNGSEIQAPSSFTEDFPSHPMDGVLRADQKPSQRPVKETKGSEDPWPDTRYYAFDLPHLKESTLEERLSVLDSSWRSSKSDHLRILYPEAVQSRDHLESVLRRLNERGSDGVIIRKPGSLYEAGRGSSCLVIKPPKEATGTVVGHSKGKGKHEGSVGALEVLLTNGKRFNVGAGLTDLMRKDPPPIGSVIMFKYSDMNSEGLPIGASFRSIVPQSDGDSNSGSGGVTR